ncbi:MAG: anti-sigma factor [Acidobacteriaceae bacterium]|nr:anti-sigma factor [Acidobacteriaceae bacterium]
MNCEFVRELISPLVDNELEAVQRSEVERHIETCSACVELRDQFARLASRVRADAPYYSASEELRLRITTALDGYVASERARPAWKWMFAAAAAGFLLALSLFFAQQFAMRYWGTPSPDLLAKELVASHVRSLMALHLFDVRSSDQHTVKPWFAGKIDFSPKVKIFTSQNYDLVGGRLDYLDSRPVAALVYQHRQHIINVFVWPKAQGKPGLLTLAVNGFNLVGWQDAGLVYWAVSDLNGTELREFARTYAQ